MSTPLRQLYDEQARPIQGKGADKPTVFTGLLHGAAHLWIWRQSAEGPEVMIQKRAEQKEAWPGLYTASVGGHIDLGEEPITAIVREAQEEIGLILAPEQLINIGMQRVYMVADNGLIENEFEWVYVTELAGTHEFVLETTEVAAIEWKRISDFREEVLAGSEMYLPFGPLYYLTLVAALEAVADKPGA